MAHPVLLCTCFFSLVIHIRVGISLQCIDISGSAQWTFPARKSHTGSDFYKSVKEFKMNKRLPHNAQMVNRFQIIFYTPVSARLSVFFRCIDQIRCLWSILRNQSHLVHDRLYGRVAKDGMSVRIVPPFLKRVVFRGQFYK